MHVVTDEDVPDSVGDFLAARGHQLSRARDSFIQGSPDYLLARGVNQIGALLMTFNHRHFRSLTKRIRKDGTPSYPRMSLVSFTCAQAAAIARIRQLIDEVELVTEYRLGRGDSRVIMEITSDSLRING